MLINMLMKKIIMQDERVDMDTYRFTFQRGFEFLGSSEQDLHIFHSSDASNLRDDVFENSSCCS
jgi:hypothetical protein